MPCETIETQRIEMIKMTTKKTTPTTKKAVNPKAEELAAMASKPATNAPQRAAANSKPAAVTNTEKKAAPAKKSANPAKIATPAEVPSINAEERWKMISEAAYFLAEKRGFTGDNPCYDWIQAEVQVDAILSQRSAGGK